MSLQTTAHQPDLPPSTVQLDLRKGVGYGAMALTIVIWVGFALTTRASHGAALAFGDIALIRAAIPTVVFLPFIARRIPMFRAAGWRRCATVSICAGVLFFGLAVIGGAATSATHVGTIIPGGVPVFVAVMIWAMTGKRPTKQGMFALGVIVLGAALLAGQQPQGAALIGILALIGASVLWACFTLSVQGGTLDPIGCVILIAVPSFIATVVLMATGILTSNWGAFTLSDMMPFVLVQGIGVGLVSTLTYTFAISRLGSTTCAALGAGTPAFTALAASIILGETLSLPIIIAALTICTGVFLTSRASR